MNCCATAARFTSARLCPADKDLLFAHFSGLSQDSRYTRFFGAKRTLTRDELARFTELDFDNQVGLTATITEDGPNASSAIGRYFRLQNRAHAEVAFAVLDDLPGPRHRHAAAGASATHRDIRRVSRNSVLR